MSHLSKCYKLDRPGTKEKPHGSLINKKAKNKLIEGHNKKLARERSWGLDRGDGDRTRENGAGKRKNDTAESFEGGNRNDTGQKRQCKVLMTKKRVEVKERPGMRERER